MVPSSPARAGPASVCRRLRWSFILIALFASGASVAYGQSSLPLLLEVSRDPGGADVASSSRSLAIGVVVAGSGAEDAVSNPAALMMGPRRSALLSWGQNGASREELVLTPRDLPPRAATRRRTPWSQIPISLAAVSMRGHAWAAGAFFDAATRRRHAFETDSNTLEFSSMPGYFIETNATGQAAWDLSLRRLGGALAVGTRRLSVGVALFAVQLDGTISSGLDLATRAFFYAPFTPSDTTTTRRERNVVRFDAWGVGVLASAAYRPVSGVVLSGRWRRDPEFVSQREWTDSVTNADVTFRPPSVAAFSATLSRRRTTAAVELVRTDYSQVFGPEPAPISPTGVCQTLRVSSCEGWGFGSYVATDATALRVGVEQAMPARHGAVLLRGGWSTEAGHTLARLATDPDIYAGQGPAPVVTTEFTPARERASTISFGVAFHSARFEIGAGAALSRDTRRFLIDVQLFGEK